MASLPFVDELDCTVDAILITQYVLNCRLGRTLIRDPCSFHLDHAAALTYIMEKV